MKKIEAPSVNEALIKASEYFKVSVSDIEYEIIQEFSKGFLGIGKKQAVIVAHVKTENREILTDTTKSIDTATAIKEDRPTPLVAKERITRTPPPIPKASTEDVVPPKKQDFNQNLSASEESIYDNFFQVEERVDSKIPVSSDEIFGDTQDLSQSLDIANIAKQVEKELQELFTYTPFNLDTIRVVPFDSCTLFIEIQGEDCALLIGKEGYRYKALSYMLFNWVNTRYNLMVRLEIASFLKNQEEIMHKYLAPIIEDIHSEGKGQTKAFDGVLAYIALKQLRAEFPDKYVSLRNNHDGQRYVVVSEFIKPFG